MFIQDFQHRLHPTKTDNYRDQNSCILVTKTQKCFFKINSKIKFVINLLSDAYVESWSQKYMRFEHKHVIHHI